MPAPSFRALLRRLRRAEPPADRVPLVGYVVHGRDGLHAPSAHVRVVQRTELLAASGRAEVAQVDPASFAAGEDDRRYDVVLVQRDAVPSETVDAFLARIATSGTRLVAEVDDDFFTDDARERLGRAEYDPRRLASVTSVVRAAATTVVSTPELAEAVTSSGGRPVVVPNQLDPRLWSEPFDRAVVPLAPVPDDDVHRVLYAGSRTHGADLALLRPVFDDLRATDGRSVRLEVVGVTEASDDWYDVLPVPDTAGHYPSFVRWLRAHADRWDAGVAPLEDTAFNRAKSDLKFVEYTLLGLPSVLSDVAPYRPHAARAAVVANDPGPWRDAVVRAIAEGRPSDAAERHVRTSRLIGADDEWCIAVGLGGALHRYADPR